MTTGSAELCAIASMPLLRLFSDGRPRTRADLIEESGRARSTVTPQLESLVARGLLLEDGVTESTGGRRPAAFVLNPDSHLILAIDLGPNHIRVAVLNLRSSILALHEEATAMSQQPQETFDRIDEIARDLLTRHNPKGLPLAGIGVGLPTPVNHSTGRPMHPPLMPRWHDYDVVARLQRIEPVPVSVDRDNNLRALAEVSDGSQDASLLYIHVSTYIGCGLILDGHLARGAQGSAGYFGHISGEWSREQLCRCGKRGCLEAVASSWAVLRDVGPSLNVSTTAELIALAASNDGLAKEALRKAGRDIGKGIANFVSVLNPSRVVIGGSLSSGNLELLSGIRETVYSQAFPLPAQLLEVRSSRTGHLAAIRGASILAREAFFDRA